MTVLEERITVSRPPGQCFRYVLDFSTIEQWDPGVYRATPPRCYSYWRFCRWWRCLRFCSVL